MWRSRFVRARVFTTAFTRSCALLGSCIDSVSRAASLSSFSSTCWKTWPSGDCSPGREKILSSTFSLCYRRFAGRRLGADARSAACLPCGSPIVCPCEQVALWLGSGMGEVISQELATAMVGLHGPEKRRGRRLVRRGEAADDVVVARYAIALARERRRRLKRSSFRFVIALGVALGLAGIVVAVFWFKRAVDAKTVAMVGFGVFFLVSGWRNWQRG
jgi:hypothetical protein